MLSDAALTRRRERLFVLAFLKRGGVVVREDLGGVVGVRWGRAHRSGAPFNTEACERLLTNGCTVAGEPRQLVTAPGAPCGTYSLEASRDPS